jgi:predicted GNAT superfamily acetyltransferase
MLPGENASMTSSRSVTLADLPTLLELNNAAVPAVNALDLAQLTELVNLSAVALTVDTLECLLVALRPGLPYASANYRWFSERYPDFLYVDRVVVAPDARGAGLGTQLYAEVRKHAQALGAPRITCEVNAVPANPGSQRFHERLGFATIGRLCSGGGKEVGMMEKILRY